MKISKPLFAGLAGLSMLAQSGCTSSAAITFNNRAQQPYTFMYGQPLNELFTGDQAGMLYTIEGKTDQVPQVNVDLNENFYNHYQNALATVTLGNQRSSQPIQIILLDENAPQITWSIPEKIKENSPLSSFAKVIDVVDWTGAVVEIPWIPMDQPIDYTAPGWISQINGSLSAFPGEVWAKSASPVSLQIIAWDGHGNFSKAKMELPAPQS